MSNLKVSRNSVKIGKVQRAYDYRQCNSGVGAN